MAEVTEVFNNKDVFEADNDSLNTVSDEDSDNAQVNNSNDNLSPKKRKTYENRKNSINESNNISLDNLESIEVDSDSSIAAASSPNTSRYGRARKPKVTEDFYNIEDIYCPYERIPSTSTVSRNGRKKLVTKLDLSPEKPLVGAININIDADNIKSDIETVLSINIPDDGIEVSKIMKIVSNNPLEQFPQKSPNLFKPVKTYAKRTKQNSETIHESFGLPDYPSGENSPYVNGTASSEDSSGEKTDEDFLFKDIKERKPKSNCTHDKNTNNNKTEEPPIKEKSTGERKLFSDQSFNSNSEPEDGPHKAIRSKFKSLSRSYTSDNNTSTKDDEEMHNDDSTKEEAMKDNVKIEKNDDDDDDNADDNSGNNSSENKNNVKKSSITKSTTKSPESKQRVTKSLNKSKVDPESPPKETKKVKKIENKSVSPVKTKSDSKKSDTKINSPKNSEDVESVKSKVDNNKKSDMKIIVEKNSDANDNRKDFRNMPEEDRRKLITNIIKSAKDFESLSKIWVPRVGDLTWSRVGKFPYWPSIVTKEPSTGEYFKTNSTGKKPSHFYHVHFFADNGRRSWVSYSHLLPFYNREDFDYFSKFRSKMGNPKDPMHESAFKLIESRRLKWEISIEEAQEVHLFSNKDRVKHFFDMLKTQKNPKKRKVDVAALTPPPDQTTKKNKIAVSPSDTKPITKIKMEDEIKVVSSEVEKVEKIKPQRKSDVKSTKLEKSKRKSTAVKGDDEESSSDSELKENIKPELKVEARETPSPTPAARLKKINLFRGLTKNRVCQLCGQHGEEVFRCKGNCNGFFHIECDQKLGMRIIKLPSYNDSKKTETDPIVNSSNSRRSSSSSTSTSTNQTDANNVPKSQEIATAIVNELLTNVFDKVEKPETVVIENVSSSKSLSIGEQIDMKLEEVMNKLMQETNYAEPTTDESDTENVIHVVNAEKRSSDASDKNTITSNNYNNNNNNMAKIKTNKKIIKQHVTGDGIYDIIEEDVIETSTVEPVNFKCAYCTLGRKPPCYACNEDLAPSGDTVKHKCNTAQCTKYYHAECLKEWPQTKWSFSTKRNELHNENLCCPYHNCHTCISDDPRAPLSKMSHEKLTKCIRCPTTYHIRSHCIPAGTLLLSKYQLVCPKHSDDNMFPLKSDDIMRNNKKMKTKVMQYVNASWCFICSTGGSLICCETCPSSFHVECLKLTPPEGRYICEECESGRLPLYNEIVWVKFGNYRWWPAQILFPAEIPERVKNMAHNFGEFVVKFFGSHDHYWVSRRRVFLFCEGDHEGMITNKRSLYDTVYMRAVEEARTAHKKVLDERANREADSHGFMKPPAYIKIKMNKPVGDVRTFDANISNTNPCECDPNAEQPCGINSYCLNRILMTECNPMVCAAGKRCCNQLFQNREYSAVEPFKTSGRGWGLRTLEPVKSGTFVIEYVGEVINETEYKRRMKRKHEQKDENYYFLTIDKERIIDAGPKGNVARFMNHSCSPNCETQKWTVNGDTRVGLFAIEDIPKGAELTFNYYLECMGEEKKECRCAAPNCSGYIGVKAKDDNVKKRKSLLKIKKIKKPPTEEKTFERINCFICGQPNAVQHCDRELCNKFYHLDCVQLKRIHEGKWICPWHSCNICSKRTTRCCYACTNSYCPLHSEGNIRYDRVKNFICKEHDKPEFIANHLADKALSSDSKKRKLKAQLPTHKKRVNYNKKSLLNLKQFKIHFNTKNNLNKSIDSIKISTNSVKLNGIHAEVSKLVTKEKEPINTAAKEKSTPKNSPVNKTKARISSEKISDIEEELSAAKKIKTNEMEKKLNTEENIPQKETPNKHNKQDVDNDGGDNDNDDDDDDNGNDNKKDIDVKTIELDPLKDNKKPKEIESRSSDNKDNSLHTPQTKNEPKLPTNETIKRSRGRPRKNFVPIKPSGLPRGRPRKYFPNSSSNIVRNVNSSLTKTNQSNIETEYQTNGSSINVEKIMVERRNKLLSPRPGVRKSLRNSLESTKLSAGTESDKYVDEEMVFGTPPLNSTFLDDDNNADDDGGDEKKSRLRSKSLGPTSKILKVSKMERRKSDDSSPKRELRKSIRQKSQEERPETPDEDYANDTELKSLSDAKKLLRRSETLINYDESSSNTYEHLPNNDSSFTDTESDVNLASLFEDCQQHQQQQQQQQQEKEQPQQQEQFPLKRKRGRPKKNKTTVTPLPIKPKQGVGRPRKVVPTPTTTTTTTVPTTPETATKSNMEEATELYKMKLNNVETITKNPFENQQVNEVKLAANIPERHLRVVLRKADVDSKIENKFIKMQNEMEKDLPIRKRTKLRYEAQL